MFTYKCGELTTLAIHCFLSNPQYFSSTCMFSDQLHIKKEWANGNFWNNIPVNSYKVILTHSQTQTIPQSLESSERSSKSTGRRYLCAIGQGRKSRWVHYIRNRFMCKQYQKLICERCAEEKYKSGEWTYCILLELSLKVSSLVLNLCWFMLW